MEGRRTKEKGAETTTLLRNVSLSLLCGLTQNDTWISGSPSVPRNAVEPQDEMGFLWETVLNLCWGEGMKDAWRRGWRRRKSREEGREAGRTVEGAKQREVLPVGRAPSRSAPLRLSSRRSEEDGRDMERKWGLWEGSWPRRPEHLPKLERKLPVNYTWPCALRRFYANQETRGDPIARFPILWSSHTHRFPEHPFT